jgi:phosphate starvation-inducible PhoH-like protein
MGKKGKKRNKPPRIDNYYEEERLSFQKTGPETIHIFESLEYRPNTTQKEAHYKIRKNTLTFLGGPAGTAKTFLPCAEALFLLSKGAVKKIYIARPAVEAGYTQGHLPGTLDEKNAPFLIPIMDNMSYFVGEQQLKMLLEAKIIEIAPIQYLRGRTLRDSFVILDEMQNATKTQLRLCLTRLGENTKCVVTYDTEQIDLKNRTDSCVHDIVHFDRAGFGFHKFGVSDIVRSEIVSRVLGVYKEIENG